MIATTADSKVAFGSCGDVYAVDRPCGHVQAGNAYVSVGRCFPRGSMHGSGAAVAAEEGGRLQRVLICFPRPLTRRPSPSRLPECAAVVEEERSRHLMDIDSYS